ncbi:MULTISPECIES: type II toxin-antitoxin system HicB family antitoxin [unclassified Adlercreutzia]|uniref:type II toxin-antitoxin system HicB family antitoxin n=1 Tax=unclassified Adlercreutzia TaxID=2636013 RepID=UPI0013EBFEE0|nr:MULTISPECIES: helix-turn-helix domain-containing protein [unclassified Adlercreutzia]
MVYVFEFEIVEEEGWFVAIPFDFSGATQGESVAEACEMAADWLRTEIEYRLMNNEVIPEATLEHKPQRGGRVLLVAVDVSLDSVEKVSAKDAAVLLGVTRSRISQMVKEGLLTGFRVGRDVYVTLDSIRARIAEKPKVGRPKKDKACA